MPVAKGYDPPGWRCNVAGRLACGSSGCLTRSGWGDQFLAKVNRTLVEATVETTMVPLDTSVQHDRDPKYDRGAWLEVSCYLGNHGRQMDYVRQVIREDPENLWALMMLAARAETAAEARALRRELIRIGTRQWAAELTGVVVPDLASVPDFYPMMVAIIHHAADLREDGHEDEARECYRLLRKLDPGDHYDITGIITRHDLAVTEEPAACRR